LLPGATRALSSWLLLLPPMRVLVASGAAYRATAAPLLPQAALLLLLLLLLLLRLVSSCFSCWRCWRCYSCAGRGRCCCCSRASLLHLHHSVPRAVPLAAY
jgi:hypothetical protein